MFIWDALGVTVVFILVFVLWSLFYYKVKPWNVEVIMNDGEIIKGIRSNQIIAREGWGEYLLVVTNVQNQKHGADMVGKEVGIIRRNIKARVYISRKGG